MKLVNGWTKDTVRERVKKYNDGSRAFEGNSCVYQNSQGNRCFIGAFIPDGHPALKKMISIFRLVKDYPDLKLAMPFASENELHFFQNCHDTVKEGDTYTSLERFLANHVEE